MSANLCPHVASTFVESTNPSTFFGVGHWTRIQEMELRENPIIGAPGESCKTNLFFGFFFDGTKNNYVQAEQGLNHSNVARLYDCYPGLSVTGVLPVSADWQYKPSHYHHFFKTYIPGVASPFKEVNDSGKDSEQTLGAAMGFRGEARIIWALIQAINNVHRYFHSAPLVSSTEATRLSGLLELTAALNAYLAASPTKHGPLSAITRKKVRLHMQWRLARRVDSINALEKMRRLRRAPASSIKTIYTTQIGS